MENNNTNQSCKYEPTVNFKNGFISWHETHYNVVFHMAEEIIKDKQASLLNNQIEKPKTLFTIVEEEGGRCALYELAENITNHFEEAIHGVFFDGSTTHYFDHLDIFLNGISELDSEAQLPKYYTDVKSAFEELKNKR